MTFSRVNPLGWAYLEVLTSAQMNQLDTNMTKALDGLNGGTYSPSAQLTVNHKIQADASAHDLIALHGINNGANEAVRGINSGAGDGVWGVANSGTGVKGISTSGVGGHFQSSEDYGVVAQGKSDPSTAGAKSAFRIVPQDADPNIQANGDMWLRSDLFTALIRMNSVPQTLMTDWSHETNRAWGNISTNPLTVNAIHGATAAMAGGSVDITLDNNMNEDYWAVEGMCYGTDRFLVISQMVKGPPSYVRLSMFDHGSGALLDLSTTSAQFTFSMQGKRW